MFLLFILPMLSGPYSCTSCTGYFDKSFSNNKVLVKNKTFGKIKPVPVHLKIYEIKSIFQRFERHDVCFIVYCLLTTCQVYSCTGCTRNFEKSFIKKVLEVLKNQVCACASKI
jgi:hypothetical protein